MSDRTFEEAEEHLRTARGLVIKAEDLIREATIPIGLASTASSMLAILQSAKGKVGHAAQAVNSIARRITR